MKALMFYGKEDLRFVEIDKPRISENDVLLKIKKVGICGTDLHIYHGGMAVPTPLVIGHEFVGEVAEIGANVKNVKVGERAVAEHVANCHECKYCLMGRKNLCLKPTVFGLDRPGALAEYMSIPSELVYALPEGMDYDAGVLVEPLSIAVYAVRKSGLKKGDEIAVIGQGPIGLFVDQIASLIGAKVTGVDVLPSRLDYALDRGLVANRINSKEENALENILRTNPLGVSCVFEVVGRQETFGLALEIVDKGGKVMVLGVFSTPASVEMMKIVKKELEVCGAWTCLNSFPETIELLASGKISTSDFITHRYSFSDAIQAFVDASSYSEARIKSVIEF